MVLTVRTGFGTDQGLTVVTIDVFRSDLNADVDTGQVVDDRLVGVVVVVHPDAGMVLADHQAVTAVVVGDDGIDDDFVEAGK